MFLLNTFRTLILFRSLFNADSIGENIQKIEKEKEVEVIAKVNPRKALDQLTQDLAELIKPKGEQLREELKESVEEMKDAAKEFKAELVPVYEKAKKGEKATDEETKNYFTKDRSTTKKDFAEITLK